MRLISDDKIEAALNFLATSSEEIAAARAQRLRAEFKRKRTRAELIRKANEATAQAREAWAESHPDYAKACEEECVAVEADEFLRDRRNAADTIVETWRTQEANQRAGGQFR
jgi:hypothetical protein